MEKHPKQKTNRPKGQTKHAQFQLRLYVLVVEACMLRNPPPPRVPDAGAGCASHAMTLPCMVPLWLCREASGLQSQLSSLQAEAKLCLAAHFGHRFLKCPGMERTCAMQQLTPRIIMSWNAGLQTMRLPAWHCLRLCVQFAATPPSSGPSVAKSTHAQCLSSSILGKLVSQKSMSQLVTTLQLNLTTIQSATRHAFRETPGPAPLQWQSLKETNTRIYRQLK